MTDQAEAFDQWMVVELFGHQRFAGRVREAQFPAGHLRLDVPATDGHAEVTQLINPQAVYRLTATTEEIARTVAARCRPQPVHRWELPAAAQSVPGRTDDGEAWGDDGPF